MEGRAADGASAQRLTIWAVTDGRIGIEAQAMGLAEAIARRHPADVVRKRIGWRFGIRRLPWNMIPRWALKADGPIRAPWPDIWIGAGRASLPLSTRVGLWSARRTFVVQTQHPREATRHMDLVIPPLHDQLEGPNVFPIVGAPNRMNAADQARDLALFKDRIDRLPRPLVAMIVGGKSHTHDLPSAHAAKMARDVADSMTALGGSLLVSFTRRTPLEAQGVLTQGLSHLPGWIWDGEGPNPYFAFLAAADIILVTEDSTNLATDAATTGKPVHVLSMAGGGEKFERFHADLQARGVTQSFDGRLTTWRYTPLDETNRAAAEVLRRFDRWKIETRP